MSRNTIREIGDNVLVYDDGKDMDQVDRDIFGLIENSHDALCVADGNSRIILLNRAFEKVMGLSVQEMVGKTILGIVEAGITDTAATVQVLKSHKEETVIINTSTGKQVLSTGVPVYDNEKRIHRIFSNLRSVADLIRHGEESGSVAPYPHARGLNGLRLKKPDGTGIVTRNELMKRLIELTLRLAQVDSSVLITGETGVGKDLFARLLHEASSRSSTGKFITVNCGAIPENLMESELFGYEPGAFTGADRKGKPGLIELAEHGTLFLDEIGDLPFNLQSKLLLVLQDRIVTRVGSTRSRKVNVRIVAATNKDLEKMVTEGNFRADLFYRLNVVPIMIPPLRERKNDIPLLLKHFSCSLGPAGSSCVTFSEEVIETLGKYSWPGNVRELMNLVEYLIVASPRPTIHVDHIPRKYLPSGVKTSKDYSDWPSLKTAVEQFETDLVEWAVQRCNTREEAAHRLGISLSSLNRRLKRCRD